MTATPDKQKAWVVVRRGKPKDVVVLREDWPVPKTLAQGEVLVRIQAAAFNPIAYKIMKMLPNILTKRPHVAEHDFSGVIVDGNGTRFSNGDPIFGWIPTGMQLKTHQGALAEYAKVPADYIVKRPENVTPIQASGLLLVGLTAYQTVYKLGKLQAGQTIFVNGGSTSVGAFSIQLAKAIGAKVVATASGRNEAFVREMGADEFIDYTKQPLVEHLTKNPPATKFNVIFETVGFTDPALYTHSAKYLAPGGIFISSGPLPDKLTFSEVGHMFRLLSALAIPSWLGGIPRRWALASVQNNVEDLKEFQKLVENGSLKPIVDSTYEFEDVPRAYDRLLSSRATGKIVVKVDSNLNL